MAINHVRLRLHGKRGQMPEVRAALDNEILWRRADSWTDARLMDWLEGARFVVQFFAEQKKARKGEPDGTR